MPIRFYTVISTCVSIAFAIAGDAFVRSINKDKGREQVYAGIVLAVFGIAAFCNIGNMRQYTGPDNSFIGTLQAKGVSAEQYRR